mgnify:CR=1 FL=1|jgi:hypothetical protein
MRKVIGIDIGGANLKYSDPEGNGRIIYFPMWLRFNELESALSEIKKESEAYTAGVVITAELSDAFASKSDGVVSIADTVKRVFDKTFFLDIDGEITEDIDEPLRYSASNWIASVSFLMGEFDEFLFIDIGSTTTDIIPVKGKIMAKKTDFERMKRGELYYAGVLRTPVYYIMPEYDGIFLASEYFACIGDILVLTGDIDESLYTIDTPDGRGKGREDCMRRIARLFCADVDEAGEDFLIRFALNCKNKLLQTLASMIELQMEKYGLRKVIGCGIGEFLIKEVTKSLGFEYISLKEEYGTPSDFFPSFAVANLIGRVER